MIPARTTIITLGAYDMPAMRSFDRGLGWREKAESTDYFASFLTSATEQRTFAQTAENAARGATVLRARGVARGDRVLISGGNSIGTIEAWLAAVHAGAIPAAVNPALTEPELQYVVDDLRPSAALLGDAQIAALLAEARDAPQAPLPGGDAADAAAIVYTSGTTSRPKGTLVRHLAYVGAGQSMRSWLGLREFERLWCVLPFFHINAQAYSLMTALANGYPLVVSPKFRASTFWRDAAELGVTEVNLIGAMLAILARQPADMFVAGALRTISLHRRSSRRRTARSKRASACASRPASGCRSARSAASRRRLHARRRRASGGRARTPAG